jgi:hypothetical protein
MAKPAHSIDVRPEDVQTIVCLYCAHTQEVGRRAMSVTCKACHKPLKLDDMTFNQYAARRSIDTCGIVVIEKKGQVVSDRLLCGGLVARGRIKANIVSRGPILVGPEAEIRGDVIAPTLAVGAGAVLEGHYRIGYPDQPIAKPTVNVATNKPAATTPPSGEQPAQVAAPAPANEPSLPDIPDA